MECEKLTSRIKNPILPGFNPDPSIVKANGRYYIAVSSFQWLPGIRIYESTNLIEWKHKTDVLTTQHDFRGNPIDCSVWAPQISYYNNKFYVVYTDVKSTTRPFKDCRNYLITSESIEGPWSEPVYLNGSGFDPSLFHDDNGKKYLLNVIWDYRLTTGNKSDGIILQEFDEKKNCLIGDVIKIFDGTELKKTEASHIYKKDGYYYLITAEGGTGKGHAVTVARSKKITGPYELDPDNPMLTSAHNPDWPFQQSGHASLIETDNNEWYMAHLMTRPVDGEYVILGRETAIQKVYWDEKGWLRLSHGGKLPAIEVKAPKGTHFEMKQQTTDFTDYFNQGVLDKEWNTLRTAATEKWFSFRESENGLRIYGGESVQSLFNHHLIGTRQKDFVFKADTEVSFEPTNFLQMAGMLLYLNEKNYIYLYITHDEKKGKVLRLMKSIDGTFNLISSKYELEENSAVKLGVKVDGIIAQFYYEENKEKKPVAELQDISFLSGGFTGNFIGLSCQDMNMYKGCHADFSYFKYKSLNN